MRKPYVALLIILTLGGAPGVLGQQTSANEYQVKAAFLYNFPKFIEWPEGTFASASSTFKFCVLGKDPFGKFLDEALSGKKIAGHSVELVRARKISDLGGCQVVFVSSAESHLPGAVASLRSQPVLLVGEDEDFVGSGGTIQFFVQDNRVRFAINPDAARKSGLKVSSKLLALASVVRDSDTAGRD